MSNSPKISVIMPVYNCEDYILEAVTSILNQTYNNFEFLIIDDASTDETVNIITRLEDERIKLIVKTKNSGYTNSLNLGLSLAKGKYIARMDGDDISRLDRFSLQIKFLEAHLDVVICGSRYKIIDENTVINVPEYDNDIKTAMLTACAMAHPSVMIRASTIKNNKIEYDIKKEPAEDYDLWVKLMKYGKLYNIQETLLYYRVHASQVSNTNKINQNKSALDTRIKLLNYINDEISEKEKSNLKSIIINEKRTLQDIRGFIKLKSMLIARNEFFVKKGLLEYLNKLENDMMENYLKRRKKFSPEIFNHYKLLKRDLTYKMSFLEELKLFVKSKISYTYKYK